ncbi:arginine repressor [Sulfobacillus thermosulfidooxidans]|uniref:Arginine repressor n=2 Tax=Sulfobacillus thermosulfidooxidans TaxID=28034 RepID=A0A1W1WIQ5_SULTA|nr:arginine repressor [Sulfobacillus thermosulfidooxidans]OLZ08532.1 arginine repressor [Sulfobacillus thermosulfidooxidans]OLZ13134.1 arginine repressor [Sulfobacillus thermosulfidooxidans]OLZ21514.1 arginine repressor [Sulfobacillus thermosulfidooxidans]PSR29210.1 MAG: arginine repressor [Sulfobacillus thermosulfidooxidans]SMC06198.1 transcriptional regulator, ArgR family [Sulfobacillus thermosulfidooxidans DSM 9293]
MRHDKRTRQSLIQEIITTQPVETQEELSEILAAKGMPATQATISRDIKDLGLIKVPYQDSHRYALPDDRALGVTRDRLRRLLREVLTGYVVSENLVVVKTLTAGAEVVSEAIDKMDWPEVAGTLAGENTVLVVARSKEEAPILAKRLEELR